MSLKRGGGTWNSVPLPGTGGGVTTCSSPTHAYAGTGGADRGRCSTWNEPGPERGTGGHRHPAQQRARPTEGGGRGGGETLPPRSRRRTRLDPPFLVSLLPPPRCPPDPTRK